MLLPVYMVNQTIVASRSRPELYVQRGRDCLECSTFMHGCQLRRAGCTTCISASMLHSAMILSHGSCSRLATLVIRIRLQACDVHPHEEYVVVCPACIVGLGMNPTLMHFLLTYMHGSHAPCEDMCLYDDTNLLQLGQAWTHLYACSHSCQSVHNEKFELDGIQLDAATQPEMQSRFPIQPPGE